MKELLVLTSEKPHQGFLNYLNMLKQENVVLFFDEFETLGKERGDVHETGEIKRVVSSLLMQIDALPSYVVVVAATNHDTLLDKAAWRRFQIRLEIPKQLEVIWMNIIVSLKRRKIFDLVCNQAH